MGSCCPSEQEVPVSRRGTGTGNMGRICLSVVCNTQGLVVTCEVFYVSIGTSSKVFV
jgi:hypothetical protein